MKKLLSFLYSRIFIVGLSLLIQIAVLVVVVWRFNQYFSFFYAVCVVLSLIAVLVLVSNTSNPAYKISWIILILSVPIFGGLAYWMFGRNRMGRRATRRLQTVTQRVREARPLDTDAADTARQCLWQENKEAARQSAYMERIGGYPVWQDTQVTYFPLGEAKWAAMLRELEKAQAFIFLEYFIIEEGQMWDAILDILKRKAAEGVEVRLMYDDMGCLFTLPYRYEKQLREAGIQCRVFNPFVPALNPLMNNRDHRKICVIDGRTGFCGGVNLADEYINVKQPYGHWKDTAVMLEGDAVRSLTLMFLTMWDGFTGEKSDFSAYCPAKTEAVTVPHGFVQPYSDSPLDDEPIGENVYIQLVSSAVHYVHITTPYLIIGNEMLTALETAAKSGVEVSIITPHISDHPAIHTTTRAYYRRLIAAGVHIFEYTPGFIHAKSFVVDGRYATVGTINLDYRSLYLHFECGVWMYDVACIAEIEDDFQQTRAKSAEWTMAQCLATPWYKRLEQALLRVIAPML